LPRMHLRLGLLLRRQVFDIYIHNTIRRAYQLKKAAASELYTLSMILFEDFEIKWLEAIIDKITLA